MEEQKKRKYTRHKARKRRLYVVYNNETDMPVCIDGTAEECAAAMKMDSVNSFYTALTRFRRGLSDKWYIAPSEPFDEEDLE